MSNDKKLGISEETINEFNNILKQCYTDEDFDTITQRNRHKIELRIRQERDQAISLLREIVDYDAIYSNAYGNELMNRIINYLNSL